MKREIYDILYSEKERLQNPEDKLNAIEEVLLSHSNLLSFGDTVRVNKLDDDTAKSEYLFKTGTVIGVNSNGETGNTKIDPLYVVQFTDKSHESFWRTELTKIS